MINESLYKQLQNQAKLDLSAKADKYRVTVQLGHCSSSLGAKEVMQSFTDHLTSNAYMVVAGCDGACGADSRKYQRDAPRPLYRSTGRIRTWWACLCSKPLLCLGASDSKREQIRNT